jgi:hypothetical protein
MPHYCNWSGWKQPWKVPSLYSGNPASVRTHCFPCTDLHRHTNLMIFRVNWKRNFLSVSLLLSLLYLLIVGAVCYSCPWAHSLTHTHTLGRSPLGEGLALRKGRTITTCNIHTRQTSMFPAGFDPAVPASRLQQTELDRAATAIGKQICMKDSSKPLSSVSN